MGVNGRSSDHVQFAVWRRPKLWQRCFHKTRLDVSVMLESGFHKTRFDRSDGECWIYASRELGLVQCW